MSHYRKISSVFRYGITEELAHRKNEGKEEVENITFAKQPPSLNDLVLEKLSQVLTRPIVVLDKGNPVLTFVRPSPAKLKLLSKQTIDQKLRPMFSNRTLTKELYKYYLKLNRVSSKPTANIVSN